MQLDDMKAMHVEEFRKRLRAEGTCVVYLSISRSYLPCRHTFVSQMQSLGVDIETIQNIVGRAEIDMTRHYLHVQEPKRLKAVQRFSEAFFKRGRGTHGNILDCVKSY